jgi:hypothetical protein
LRAAKSSRRQAGGSGRKSFTINGTRYVIVTGKEGTGKQLTMITKDDHGEDDDGKDNDGKDDGRHHDSKDYDNA